MCRTRLHLCTDLSWCHTIPAEAHEYRPSSVKLGTHELFICSECEKVHWEDPQGAKCCYQKAQWGLPAALTWSGVRSLCRTSFGTCLLLFMHSSQLPNALQAHDCVTPPLPRPVLSSWSLFWNTPTIKYCLSSTPQETTVWLTVVTMLVHKEPRTICHLFLTY